MNVLPCPTFDRYSISHSASYSCSKYVGGGLAMISEVNYRLTVNRDITGTDIDTMLHDMKVNA